MSGYRWKSRSKRAREASVREQEQILDALLQEEEKRQQQLLPPSDLHIYRHVHGSAIPENPVAYPFRFGGDPFPYYRFTPYYFGGTAAQEPQSTTAPSQSVPSQKSALKKGNASQKKVQVKTGAHEGRQAGDTYPNSYGYYPYPVQYPYPAGSYGYNPYQPGYTTPAGYNAPGYGPGVAVPVGADGGRYPEPREPSESEDESQTIKSGMMSVEGRRPLFLVALFVVSIAVLLVSFPLTLLSAGYIGPLGLMFATGPFATVFAFWAIYLTPCECYPNIEWAVSRIRVFATTAAVFDAVGTIGVPISMYGAQCPDDDDTMLGCEDELPAAKGVSLAVAVVLGTHCFLCLLVRSNARKLAESKFGDERTEGITLTPTPFDRPRIS